ncbi:MAG: hypothetical protein MRERC_2c125 [Mycoplasmataceae bacterium RC_NB112A]|nr:MAG: hypothetical protein MRERC_2c125 [Mycoplasmataceae bacterium RC_NB112A]
MDNGREVADLLACDDLVTLPVGGDKNRQLAITKWGKKLVHIYNFKHQQIFPNITTYPVIALFSNS